MIPVCCWPAVALLVLLAATAAAVFISPKISYYPYVCMTRDTLWLGRAYEFVRIYFLATGELSNSRWQIGTRWLCFFYRKSTVGPPRPRFCCSQYHIISYVRSCCTTASCRRFVLLLHTTTYEMLRLLLAALLPESLRSSCYYCCSCTTAQLLLLLFLFLSVFSYMKNQSRPTKIHCCGK